MNRIYYLPGRDSGISDAVGQAINKLGFDVIGRDLLPDFINYRISRQVEIIKQDINEHAFEAGSILVARSYGAFLLLQALVEMKPFPGKVLLFSPVLGPAKVESGGSVFFRPPRANKLLNAAKEGNFPVPEYLEIHTGTEDRQCHSSMAEQFSQWVSGTKLTLVQKMGHSLEQKYIEEVLVGFLFGH